MDRLTGHPAGATNNFIPLVLQTESLLRSKGKKYYDNTTRTKIRKQSCWSITKNWDTKEKSHRDDPVCRKMNNCII